MRLKHFILLISMSLTLVHAQQLSIKDIQLLDIQSENDTIYFIKIGDTQNKPKPTILFCQGSLPIPLIVQDGTDQFVSCLNFDYKTVCEKYNIIIISQPHTPPIADSKLLNKQYAYAPNPNHPVGYDSLYLKDNYLGKYVERANKVINFLAEQTWVDKNQIAVIGHSQGTYTAAILAKENPNISILGYFSGNPDGRLAQLIKQERKNAQDGKISHEEAQKNINNYYSQWTFFSKGIEPPGYIGDPANTWKSFSISLRETLSKLEKPIYIAYGTQDIGSQACDLLPIYFEAEGKSNYKLRPFLGCGHNFEEITPDGKSNWDKMYWDEAINEFITWWETLIK